jgi:hypothetical protein
MSVGSLSIRVINTLLLPVPPDMMQTHTPANGLPQPFVIAAHAMPLNGMERSVLAMDELPRYIIQDTPNGCDPDECEWYTFIKGLPCENKPKRVIVEVSDMFHHAHLCDEHILLGYDLLK